MTLYEHDQQQLREMEAYLGNLEATFLGMGALPSDVTAMIHELRLQVATCSCDMNLTCTRHPSGSIAQLEARHRAFLAEERAERRLMGDGDE